MEEGYFGYAVASGDLDADGFDGNFLQVIKSNVVFTVIFNSFIDIIVGAPWEKSGVVYIYNGGSDLKNKKLQASEQIQPIDILNNIYTIERFGFSISKPVDIDGNGLILLNSHEYFIVYIITVHTFLFSIHLDIWTLQ